MNKSQQNYLKQRINQIRSDKEKDLKEKYDSKLTHEQKYAMVKNGTAKLLPLHHQSTYNHEEYDFDFSSFEVDAKEVPEYKRAIAKLDHKAQEIKDEIMLGDCEKATQLLKEFESIKI